MKHIKLSSCAMYSQSELVEKVKSMGLPMNRQLVQRFEDAGAIAGPVEESGDRNGRRPKYGEATRLDLLTYLVFTNLYKPFTVVSRTTGKLEAVKMAREAALKFEASASYSQSTESRLLADFCAFFSGTEQEAKIAAAYFFARQLLGGNIAAKFLVNVSVVADLLGKDFRRDNAFSSDSACPYTDIKFSSSDNEYLQRCLSDGKLFIQDLNALGEPARKNALAWLLFIHENDVSTGGLITSLVGRSALAKLGVAAEDIYSRCIRLLADLVFAANKK